MIVSYPVKNSLISQEFGRDTRQDPIYSKFYEVFDYKHCGVDFPVSVGTNVFASFSGIVVRSENHSGMGNVAGIRNGNIVALYAHLSKINVNLDDLIEEGDKLGLSGDSGKACTLPHLHFELRDITKPTLKEMVFDPPFEKEVSQWKDTFIYKVNNKNTKKSLKLLSILYFGKEDYWMHIRDTNNFNIEGDSLLEDGLEVTIPNFK